MEVLFDIENGGDCTPDSTAEDTFGVDTIFIMEGSRRLVVRTSTTQIARFIVFSQPRAAADSTAKPQSKT
jgi:hypothetical protein